MKGLVIGDLHFKVNNSVELIEVSQQLINIATTKRPDFIVLLGDILDTNDKINLIPLTNATSLLHSLSLIAPIYIIIGNHDWRNHHIYQTNEHPFNAFKMWPNTTVIDYAQIVTINHLKLIMAPFIPTGRFTEALEKIDTTDVICTFCHQEFKGAKMGPIISDGDEWHKTYIISGHIHDYQEIDNHILYLGTPIQHKYGDDPYKIVGLFTFTKPLLTHNDVVVEKIKLNIPTKKIIHLRPDQLSTFKFKDINPQIVITGKEQEINQILRHPSFLKLKKKGIKMITKYHYDQVKVNKVEPLPFKEALYNLIKNNFNLVNLYKELI